MNLDLYEAGDKSGWIVLDQETGDFAIVYNNGQAMDDSDVREVVLNYQNGPVDLSRWVLVRTVSLVPAELQLSEGF